MQCLSEGGQGMLMKTIKGDNPLTDIIEGFVDDTSLFGNRGDNLKQLMENISGDANLWNDLLQASGGLLERSKCFYYLLSWKFDNGGNPIPETISEQSGRHDGIVVMSQDKTTVVIEQKEPEEAHKTLGAYINVVGTCDHQCHVLYEKSRTFAEKVTSAKLSRYQATLAYNCMYMPMLLYCTPACNLTDKQVNMPQNTVVNVMLPATGYCRSTPKAIVYGPSRYGGTPEGFN
jgi:hypothetical protein